MILSVVNEVEVELWLPVVYAVKVRYKLSVV